jgi:hypothetical protein
VAEDKRIVLARHGQTFRNAAAGESYGDVDRLSPRAEQELESETLSASLLERSLATVLGSIAIEDIQEMIITNASGCSTGWSTS